MNGLLILAAIYGTLVGGELVNAPKVVNVDGYWRASSSITEAQANGLGYKLVVDEAPACAANEYAVAVGWTEDTRIRRVYEKRAVEPTPRMWTPLSIKRACGDKWAAVRAALQSADIYEEFVMAQEIIETDDSFKAGYAWACAEYGKEAVDAILNAAEVR